MWPLKAPGQMVRLEVAPIDENGVGEAQPYNMVLGEGRAIPDVEERVMTLRPAMMSRSWCSAVPTVIRWPPRYAPGGRDWSSASPRTALRPVNQW